MRYMKRNIKIRYLFYGLNIFIPLLFGLFLYLKFRREAYVSQIINKYITFPVISFSFFPRWLIPFFRNFASDILWAYSLGFAVQPIIGYSRKNLLFTFLLCVCFEILLEVLQKIDVFHGTFDLLDIIFEAISVCLSLIIIKNFEEV